MVALIEISGLEEMLLPPARMRPTGKNSTVENDKNLSKFFGSLPGSRSAEMEQIYRKLEPELRRSRPNPEAIAAALEAVQRLATQADAQQAAEPVAQQVADDLICRVCGHHNKGVGRFCGMCGVALGATEREAGYRSEGRHPDPSFMPPPNSFAQEQEGSEATNRSAGRDTHYYHHHYHHHYFPAGYEGSAPRGAPDTVREDKIRPNLALRGDMSRLEAAVRRVSHEWVVACNTKHLDDLLELYAADALVLRSNYPPVRGAAAIREFFFGALEAGLGEVEMEPLRVEVVGDLAYEAGRCKALVPGSAGKRREERGKYLWVCGRQGDGEWKLTADCWSSDLSLTMLESDVPAGPAIRTAQPRKP
jgi:uncharacterized protein (TIGR02246 family)